MCHAFLFLFLLAAWAANLVRLSDLITLAPNIMPAQPQSAQEVFQVEAALTCCCRPSSSSACCVSDSCRKVLRADCRAQAACQISTLEFRGPCASHTPTQG